MIACPGQADPGRHAIAGSVATMSRCTTGIPITAWPAITRGCPTIHPGQARIGAPWATLSPVCPIRLFLPEKIPGTREIGVYIRKWTDRGSVGNPVGNRAHVRPAHGHAGDRAALTACLLADDPPAYQTRQGSRQAAPLVPARGGSPAPSPGDPRPPVGTSAPRCPWPPWVPILGRGAALACAW